MQIKIRPLLLCISLIIQCLFYLHFDFLYILKEQIRW